VAALQGGWGEGVGEEGNPATYARRRRRCLPLACQHATSMARRGVRMWTTNEPFDVKIFECCLSILFLFSTAAITQIARALNQHVEPLSAIKAPLGR
jgi:hypothetical protein